MTDDFPEAIPAKPVWLITLADLALLLVGFFVLIHATQSIDRKALAKGIRDGFGAPALVDPMPVAAVAMFDFTPGSAELPASPDPIIAWARQALADPRVTIRISGSTEGSLSDVDADTGSAAILAADRARAVATVLARAEIKARDRITIVNASATARRGVILTQGFVGDRP
ncbi:hypothetical protein BH09PSE4_BH09PSE4_20120 [soil metagenome]